ncbi:MAG: hypothetical protein JSS27_04845 [Planctomycetes bacterium]|nr:hypothetical protein [Planctomycetota bacterium]
MNQAANVRSIDALRDFRVAILNFRDGGNQALATVQVEIRRTLDWLCHDQAKYWQQEIRRREERVNEAKMELSRCMMSKNAAGEPPACTEQKVLLAKAKAALAAAEEKLEKVRHWALVLQQEVEDFRGPSQVLGSRLDVEIPQAATWLEQSIAALEAYIGFVAATDQPALEPVVQAAPVYPELTPTGAPEGAKPAQAAAATSGGATSSEKGQSQATQ